MEVSEQEQEQEQAPRTTDFGRGFWVARDIVPSEQEQEQEKETSV